MRESFILRDAMSIEPLTMDWPRPTLPASTMDEGAAGKGLMLGRALQDIYGPNSTCFGCGPANAKGLRVRSFVRGDEVVADWLPEPHHEAYAGALCGGVIGTLLDCHSNWTAAWHLMKAAGADRVPYTVTAEYTVTLLAPTPTGEPVHISARVVQTKARKAVVEAEMSSGGRVTARSRGVFVAVRGGHPAYGRW
jgi:acyl-coenzyme A thioesterase PaaI-like protein